MIFPGQTLLIPLPTARITVSETDLNCDGILERISVIPDPQQRTTATNFGLTLEILSSGGTGASALFTPIWDLSIRDLPVDFFTEPVIIETQGCERLISVDTFSTIGIDVGTDIYRWNGVEMERVLDAAGWLQNIPFPENNPEGFLEITTSKISYDPIAASCQNEMTSYLWDGDVFRETGLSIERGLICFPGSE